MSTPSPKLGIPIPADNETVNLTNFTAIWNRIDAAAQKNITISSTAPSSPVDQDLWIDTSASPYMLKEYSAANTAWEMVGSPTASAATATSLGLVETAQTVSGNPVASTRVADQESVSLTTTAATTVATFTPTQTGFFDIACHFRLTANASVGIAVTYAGSQGALTTTILNSTAYTFNSAAGADNDYDTIPVTIRAVAGTAINVQFTASVANAVVASANITGR